MNKKISKMYKHLLQNVLAMKKRSVSCNNKILPLTIIQNQVMAQKFMEKKEISKHPS